MKKIILIFSLVFLGAQYSSAQCTITVSANTTVAQCGGCVDLEAVAVSQPPVLSTDFNNNQLGPGWASNVPVIYSNPCGPPPDGSAAAWFGQNSQPREVETNDFDVSCGGEICFEMRYEEQGASGSTGNCEGPDLATEGVNLMYSINGGTSWVLIQYWPPNGGYDPQMTTWNQYCLPIPAAAQTTSTRFRWYQDVGSGASYDHWGLDNVEIIASDCGYHYDWLVDGTPNSQDTTVCPTAQTTYDVIYTNGIDDTCATSIVIDVLNPDIDPYTDQLVCDNYTLPAITGSDLSGNEAYYDGPNGTGTQYAPGDVISAGTTIYAYDGTSGCNDEEQFDIIITGTLVDVDTSGYILESCPNSEDGAVDADIDVNQAGTPGVNITTVEWTSPSGVVTTDNGGNGQTNYTSPMTGMESGTWTIVVTLDNGCDITETIEIEEFDPLLINVDNIVDLDCAFEDSAAINVTVTGGSTPYSYQWDDPNNTTTEDIDEIPAGTYNLVVTDDNGCTDDVQVIIQSPTPISIIASQVCDGTLAGNSIEYTVSGGLPADAGSGGFTIINSGDGNLSSTNVGNNGTVVVSNLENQDFSEITAVDGNGCSLTNNNTFQAPEFSTTMVPASDCGNTAVPDGSVTVDVVPGSGTGGAYTIDLNGNPTTGITATAPGLFAGTNVNILVADVNGCVTDSAVTVGSNGAGVNMVEDLNVDASCFGFQDGQLHIDLTVVDPGSGGYTISSIIVESPSGFTENDPTGVGQTTHTVVVDTAEAGNWLITVELDNGCVFSTTYNIDQPNILDAAVVTSQISCHDGNDGSIDLTVTGGSSPYNFSWTGPITSNLEDIDQLQGGEYICTITDDNGCTIDIPVELPNPDEFSADIDITPPTCHQGQDGTAEVVNIQGNNGTVSFVWSTDNPNGNTNPVTNLKSGTHTVQLFDQNGCDYIIEFDIPEVPPFVVNNLGSTPSKCRSNGLFPGTGQVTANVGGSNGGISIQWYGNGETANTPTWGNRTPGTYTFIATDIKGCEYIDSVVVDSINPTASFTATPTQGNAPLVVDVTNTSTGIDQNNASYSWDPGFGFFNSTEVYSYAPDTTYTEGGNYIITLVVTNEYGCKDTATQEIIVFTPLDYTPPNIFSPNGDQDNEVFYIPGQGISAENFTMTVFNRWGEKLYFTEVPGPTGGWDGNNKKGKPMPEGVYSYIYTIQAEDGEVVEGQGFIHLVREK